MEKFMELVERYYTLDGIASILFFDMSTIMPPKGDAGRGVQIGAIEQAKQQTLLELGAMLPSIKQGNLSSDEQVIVREMEFLYLRAEALPSGLVNELSKQTAITQSAWRSAKKASDFDLVVIPLTQLTNLRREVAGRVAAALGGGMTSYEALLSEFMPGATEAKIGPVLSDLGEFLSGFVAEIKASGRSIDVDCVACGLNNERLLAFAKKVIGAIGFDFEGGHVTLGVHPMMCRIAPGDVRISTRFDGGGFKGPFFGLLHETGHAMYEQAFPFKTANTPLGQSCDLAVHESQSRFWENSIGRSEFFWKNLFPQLKEEFPEAFIGVDFTDFMHAINAVNPCNMIRVKADEVTYNLHIVLRYGLERDLMNGIIQVDQLPSLWNARCRDLFGLMPTSDSEGVLQDIHWYGVGCGYFPSYTLGNLMAAQIYHAMERDGAIDSALIGNGDFSAIRRWLNDNIWRHGKRYYSGELIERATGSPLSADPFKKYLAGKIRPMYGI